MIGADWISLCPWTASPDQLTRKSTSWTVFISLDDAMANKNPSDLGVCPRWWEHFPRIGPRQEEIVSERCSHLHQTQLKE